MFALFVYIFVVLFVLCFVGESHKQEPVIIAEIPEFNDIQPTPQWIEQELAKIEVQNFLDELLGDLEFGPSQIVQQLEQRNADEVAELTAISSSDRPISWALPQPQLRALCNLYGVKHSKRGRIGSSAIAQLQEVA